MAVRRTQNTIHLQTIRSEESVVHFEYNLSTTGLRTVILIKESLKEGPG